MLESERGNDKCVCSKGITTVKACRQMARLTHLLCLYCSVSQN